MIVKHKVGLSLALAVLALSACSKLKEQPVVDYVMKDFKAESIPGCKWDSDSVCAIFQVQYPDFIGLDTTTRNSITDRIVFALDDTGKTNSFEQLGGDFVNDYKDFLKDMPDYDLGWYSTNDVSVMISSDTLISLQVESGSFTGGPHENRFTTFVNIEPKTGTEYLIDEMLRPGFQDDLNRLGEEEFRNQLRSGETDSLATLNLPDDEFKLPDNYGFRKEGIVFYFNSYELGSFLDGPFEILIPYEKLRDWMK
jgi:hypothetical protein